MSTTPVPDEIRKEVTIEVERGGVGGVTMPTNGEGFPTKTPCRSAAGGELFLEVGDMRPPARSTRAITNRSATQCIRRDEPRDDRGVTLPIRATARGRRSPWSAGRTAARQPPRRQHRGWTSELGELSVPTQTIRRGNDRRKRHDDRPWG